MSARNTFSSAVTTLALIATLAVIARLDKQTSVAPVEALSKPIVTALDPQLIESINRRAPVQLSAPKQAEPGKTTVAPVPQTPAPASTPVRGVLQLQKSNQTSTAVLTAAGGYRTSAALTNLNPNTNAWFLLNVADVGSGKRQIYHFENRFPQSQQIQLAAGTAGLTITSASGTVACDLISGTPSALRRASESGLPYSPLCDGKLFLRNKVEGEFTGIERVTDFLRQNVWSGEDIVGFVRDTVYQDAYRETGTTDEAGPEAQNAAGAPPAAELNSESTAIAVSIPNFAISVEGAPAGKMALGRWYAVRGMSGVFTSMMKPKAVSDTLKSKDSEKVNPLDPVESDALVIATAFDMSQYEIGYGVGTNNPGVGWSVAGRRNGNAGPDGFGTVAPLVVNGMASPAYTSRIVATFSGGFKRDHSSFGSGEFARKNNGSHYGFIEQGVVFSTLHTGLATLYAKDDGSVHMESWREENNATLSRVRSARQNGVALIELGPSGEPQPGRYVKNWSGGNWSSSLDSQLRTLRAGACMIDHGGKQFLVQAVFSTATPSAMALTFHAYGCRYAMLLDMNALEHAYLALYVRDGKNMQLQHPFFGMTDADKTVSGRVVPRFIGFPDNRDFFFVMRRTQPRK